MCMFDSHDDGCVTMLTTSTPKARKAHRCAECGREIAAGEQYRSERFVFDGSLSVHKTCSHCMVARDWLQAQCGGFIFGAVEDDLREHALEGGIFGPRGYGLRLGRMAVGMRAKWRNSRGLLPVPAMPITAHDLHP